MHHFTPYGVSSKECVAVMRFATNVYGQDKKRKRDIHCLINIFFRLIPLLKTCMILSTAVVTISTKCAMCYKSNLYS